MTCRNGDREGIRGEDDEVVQPRKFQEELLEIVQWMNTIVYLETGSGKTHLAVMLLKEKRHQIIGCYSKNAKRSIFLATSNFLVEQQREYLQKHMPSGINVGSFVGNQGVEYWSKERWEEEIENVQVLVMTPVVLRDALTSGYLNARRINLMVFDECHEAVKDAPYCKIMEHVFQKTKDENRPLILGLTATVVNDKADSQSKIMESLNNLEGTFRAAVIGPREVSGSAEYATCAQEILHKYSVDKNSRGNSTTFVKQLQEAKTTAEELSREVEARTEKDYLSTGLKGSVITSNPNPYDDLKRLFMEWEVIASSLGSFASASYGKCVLSEMEGMMRRMMTNDESSFKLLLRQAGNLQSIAEGEFKDLGTNGRERISRSITPKVRDLIKFLTAYYNDRNADARCDSDESGHQRAIVFVERRATAEGLKALLIEYARATGELAGMQVDSVRGAQAPRNTFKGDASQMTEDQKRRHLALAESKFGNWHHEMKHQLERLERFRMGELNLLIATDVLEQGIDVPSCNLVIKFDRTRKFKSHVQARGRARSKPAKYIIFMEADSADGAKDEMNIEKWRRSEKILLEVCAKRVVPVEEDIQRHRHLEKSLAPFVPEELSTGAVLNPDQAIVRVHKYVQRYGAWYKPVFSCESYGAVGSQQNSPVLPFEPRNMTAVASAAVTSADDPRFLSQKTVPATSARAPAKTGFKFYLCFPPLTSVATKRSRIIESEIQPSKQLAKQDVCLKACKILYELGELDDHLSVKKLDETLGDPDATFEDEDPRPEEMRKSLMHNDRKNMRLKPVELCTSFQDCRPKAGVPLFLYKLDLTTVAVFPDKSLLARMWDPENAPFSIGILTRKSLPELNKFPLFPKQATVIVTLNVLASDITLSQGEIRSLEKFYSQICVRHVMQIDDPLMEFDESASSEGPLFVPIENWRGALAMDFATGSLRNLEVWDSVQQENRPDLGDFQDAVVKKANSNDKNFYVVVNVRGGDEDSLDDDDMCWPQTGDSNDGVLEVVYQTRSLAMLKSRYADQTVGSEKRDEDNIQELNPGSCFVSPVPTSLWLQILMIPSAFKRVDSLLKAAELRDVINIGRRDPGITFEGKPALASVAFVPMKKETAGTQLMLPQPPVSVILEAVTARTANEMFDMERFETLGDSVLKYVECLTLYLRYETAAEGSLSCVKGRAVSNKNLKRLIDRKEISKYWNAAPGMKPRHNWLPPLFSQPTFIDEAFLNSTLRHDKWDEGPLLVHAKSGGGISSLDPDFVSSAVKKMESRTDDEGVAKLHELKNFYTVGKKTFGDCAEALAGVYLAWTGLRGAYSFYRDWLGLGLLPWDELQSKIKSPVVCPSDEEWKRGIHKKVEGLQAKLGYQFRDIMFLVQAVTHPSYTGNIWTPAYERLEFLGDAVLDYLVTVHIFSNERINTPGQLTRLRSSLTSTVTLACLAVENNLHNELLVADVAVDAQISKFAHGAFARAGADWMTADFLGQGRDPDTATMGAVPKALADVFEALVGAVFVDSGLNLETVWSMFFRPC